MAHIDVSGISEIMDFLQKKGESTETVANAMLTIAGKLVAEGYQYSLVAKNHIDTHELFDSIKPSKPKGSGSARVITIAPRGTHTKHRSSPIANAYKGTILNSGRRGTHWADEAFKNVEGPAVAAMENVFDEWYWQGSIPSAGADWADFGF